MNKSGGCTMTSYNNHGREKIPKTGKTEQKQNQQSKWQRQQQQRTQYQWQKQRRCRKQQQKQLWEQYHNSNNKDGATQDNKDEDNMYMICMYIYIYIYIYIHNFCIKNVININCKSIDDPFLRNEKDSQGVISNM